jgi:hypothetical protein
VGAAWIVIAGLAYWRGYVRVAEVTAGLGVVLVVAGLLLPTWLKIPNRLWLKFSHALGWFNTRLILSLMFILVFVPIGLWWRIWGKDPMSRTRQTWPGWSPRPERYKDARHFTKRY